MIYQVALLIFALHDYLLYFGVPLERQVVSVIIPCYNCGKWLHETLHSLESQTFKHFNVILVDDGSTEPFTISTSMTVNVVAHKRNLRLSSARNTGALYSNSQFIIFLDPDDLIVPDCLSKLVLFYVNQSKRQSTRRLGWVYPGFVHFRSEPVYSILAYQGIPFNSKQLLKSNYMPSFALIPRELYIAAGGMCAQWCKYYEDYDFWLRLVALGFRGELLDEEGLFWYRRHWEGRTGFIEKEVGEGWRAELVRNNPTVYGNLKLEDDASDEFIREKMPCYMSMQSKSSAFKATRDLSIDFEYMGTPKQSTDVILVVPYLKYGGADKYDLQVVKLLHSMGLKVSIWTELGEVKHEMQSAYRPYVQEILHLSSFNVDRELIDHLMETRSPKVIYIRNSMLGYKLARIYRHRNIKFVDVQHLDTPSDRLGWEWSTLPFHRFIHKRIVISERLQAINRNLTKDDAKFAVIKPFVNETIWTSNEYQPCKDHIPTLAFVGRLEDQKDPFAFLSLCTGTFACMMIGTGSLTEQLDDAIIDKNLSVFRKDWLDDVDLRDILISGVVKSTTNFKLRPNSNDCRQNGVKLIISSRNEGIPFTVLEALALGIPVWSLDVGAISEVPGVRLFSSLDEMRTALQSDQTDLPTTLPGEYSIREFNAKMLGIFTS